MRTLVGLDIGATGLKAGEVSFGGRILRRVEHPTESQMGTKRVVENILKVIGRVASEKTAAIGIGCPGPLDLKKGKILNTPNIPLQNVALRSIVRKRFGLPVALENDANAYIYGETLFGAGKGHRNVVGLTIGTGMGGAVIIGGRIYRGRGNAGELGHVSISYRGLKGNHGSRGELEEYVSLRGVLRKAKKLGCRTPKDLFELAKRGNKEALRIWEQEGFYLGVALTDILHTFDPDIIIIGGNIANAWNFFSKKMKETVKKRSMFRPCPIVKRRLANRAGILGAAMLAKELAEKNKKTKKRNKK